MNDLAHAMAVDECCLHCTFWRGIRGHSDGMTTLSKGICGLRERAVAMMTEDEKAFDDPETRPKVETRPNEICGDFKRG